MIQFTWDVSTLGVIRFALSIISLLVAIYALIAITINTEKIKFWEKLSNGYQPISDEKNSLPTKPPKGGTGQSWK